MKTTAKSRNFVPHLFGFLSEKNQQRIVGWMVRRKYRNPEFGFPIAAGAVKKTLVILPEKPLIALHQTSTILSLISHFTHAEFVFLCAPEVAPYVSTMFGGRRIIECNESARLLFSNDHTQLAAALAQEEFDVCLILERSPDLALLYFAGASGAPVRGGFHDAAEYPFINLHVRPSAQQTYLSDYSLAMAQVLGAARKENHQWTVAKKSIEEITHLIHESIPSFSSPLAGLDIRFFFNTFGASWTEALIEALRRRFSFTFYGYADAAADGALLEWLRQKNVPYLSDLTVPRAAALIFQSALMICGNSVLFQLVNLLGKPALGVFEEQDVGRFFKTAPHLRCVCYRGRAESATIDAMVDGVSKLDSLRFKKA
jgi:ADP-heptose:LPS heptosyltransferase